MKRKFVLFIVIVLCIYGQRIKVRAGQMPVSQNIETSYGISLYQSNTSLPKYTGAFALSNYQKTTVNVPSTSIIVASLGLVNKISIPVAIISVICTVVDNGTDDQLDKLLITINSTAKITETARYFNQNSVSKLISVEYGLIIQRYMGGAPKATSYSSWNSTKLNGVMYCDGTWN